MQLINHTSDLQALCARFAKHSFVTVDLEFIREKTYFPQLCLIQTASEEEAAVIDPLAEGIDLASFFELMGNKNITKVFHSCRQDIEIIFELSGIIPQPLFDTQIAAMVCGFGESISYERLVKSVLNIELDKTDRLSNWMLRPLDPHQLEYAVGDVTHLVKLYAFLNDAMAKQKRSSWIAEENAILCRSDTYVTAPENIWRKIRHRSHNCKVLSALRDLAAWREIRARNKNVPRQSIINDETLVMIATARPQNREQLMQIRGIRKDVASGKLADEMLQVLQNVKIDTKITKELAPELPPANAALTELFKLLLKIISQKEGVVGRLIASDTDLQRLAGRNDSGNPLLSGWRYEIFGKHALKLRNGELSVHYNPQTKNIEFI